MCHLVLLMPVFGLVLFLILPLSIAAPAYLVIVLTSIMLFYKVWQAMRLPICVGQESLIGTMVEVVAEVQPPCADRYLVRQGGELWSVFFEGRLKPGDKAVIVGFEGTQPKIRSLSGGSAPPPITERKAGCH